MSSSLWKVHDADTPTAAAGVDFGPDMSGLYAIIAVIAFIGLMGWLGRKSRSEKLRGEENRDPG